MKQVKSMLIAISLLCVATIAFGHAGDQVKKVPSEYIGQGAQVIEIKEAYKVDDAEYTVALVSKSRLDNIPGIGSEGIALLGGVALIVGLFKRNPVATCLGLFAVAAMFYSSEVSAGILAIVPTVKVDTTGLEDNSPEKKLIEDIGKRIKLDGVTEMVTKKDIDDAIKVLSEETKGLKGLNSEKLAELLDEKKGAMAIIIKQGLKLTELEQKGTPTAKKDWRKMIADEFSNEDKLKRLYEVAKNEAGMAHVFGNPEKFEDGVGVVNKVVGTILTTAVTTDTGGNALLDLLSVDDLRSINIQEPFIENFATVGRTSKPVYPYADYQPKDGDAAFTAENAAKSQIDLKVVVKAIVPKKVTGYSTLSTESVEDIPRMQSEATSYILRKVLLKRQAKVLFGTGAGNDPNGVAGIAKTYNNAGLLDHQGNALTDSASLILQAQNTGVVAPNLYDVIQACALQIFQTANYVDEMEYYPNLVILNPSDLAQLRLKKNNFNQYLFPELIFNNGANPVKIGNLNVIGKAQIAPGKIMIGDFTRLNIINYIDYTVRMGWINDNLINNLFTMVGETRFFTLVRALDQNAFIYDDIATIIGKIGAP